MPDQVRDAGYSAADLMAAGVLLWQLGRAAVFTVAELREARPHLTAEELREAGFPPSTFEGSGFSVQELISAGFSIAEVSECGFSAKEIDSVLNPRKKPGRRGR